MLIWIGAAVSLAGLAGIIGCVIAVLRARRRKLDDAAMRESLRKVIPWNLAALLVSAFGLMMVVVGIILG